MEYFAEVKYLLTPDRCHRLFLCLRAQNDTQTFEAKEGSGAFIHIVNTKLGGALWEVAREKAVSHLGSLQPIQMIDLNADDLNHLTCYRTN
jgi:hypothetical protein